MIDSQPSKDNNNITFQVVTGEQINQNNEGFSNYIDQVQNQYNITNQVDRIDERDIIYQANIYDKLILSPIEKYQKYGKFPSKMCVHIFLVILTSCQILYAQNTLSTNSTEQYEQWRQLFFQQDSNTNVKNYEFENKIIYYTKIDTFQKQLLLMFEEMNKNNTDRIQDVYFNYTDIFLNVYYNYPMDPYLYYHPIEEQDDQHKNFNHQNNTNKNNFNEDHYKQTNSQTGQKENKNKFQEELLLKENHNQQQEKQEETYKEQVEYQNKSMKDIRESIINKRESMNESQVSIEQQKDKIKENKESIENENKFLKNQKDIKEQDNNQQKIDETFEFQSNQYNNTQNKKNRDFYNELNSNMQYKDIQRQLFSKKKNNKQNINFQQQNKPYDIAQLIFPIQRSIGIVQPFNMNDIKQIKKILSFTDRLQILLKNVILIKSKLVSCWEFDIDYTLYGQASIRALLLTDGGVCSEDLFQKAINLHKEEYGDDDALNEQNLHDNNIDHKTDFYLNQQTQENQKQQTESEIDIKNQQMKIRSSTFKSKTKSKRKYSKKKLNLQNPKNTAKEQPVNQSNGQYGTKKSNYINGQQKPKKSDGHTDFERNGNLYKSGNHLFIGFNTFIDVLTLLSSIFSLMLCMKYLVEIMDIYLQTFKKSTKVHLQKDQRQQLIQGATKNKSKYLTLQRILAEQRPWHELSLLDKLSYFDLWFFAILLGNFFQLIGSFYLLFLDSQYALDQRTSIVDWTVGLGCFCSWFSLMKYLEYSSSLSIILDVLKFALPGLFKVLIEFSLLYMSFLIIGMTSFWQSERFADFRSTSITLIGLVMGDSIYDVIQDCQENTVLPPFLVQIYVMLFVLMFIVCVTNIMIGILEDGYSRNKQENKFKKKIESIKCEKERVVVSKYVQNKESQRKNVSRRQDSFDSDDGIAYGNNAIAYGNNAINQYALSPLSPFSQQQSRYFFSPPANTINSNNSTPGMQFSQSSNLKPQNIIKSQDKKMSPVVKMKMVTNAGLAIQKVQKFVQISKKKQQEKINKQQQKQNELNTPSNQSQRIGEKQLLEEKSLFDESDQPIFKMADSIIDKEKLNQKEKQEQISKEKKQEQANQKRINILRKKQIKCKTLQNLSIGQPRQNYQIDELTSESDENEQIEIKQAQSFGSDSNSEFFNEKKNKQSKKITFQDKSLKSSDKQKKKITPQEIFKKELEAFKNKEIFIEDTEALFNNSYKQLKSLIEESSRIMRNTKFFQISKSQMKDVIKKYQQIIASLLELKHFKMD